jgi:phospho-N-acetylmuramoyl-pentapeptide-transferase
LTDGIDGLAAGLAVQCGIIFFLIGSDVFGIGQFNILFWAALAGACLGFLHFNKYKARVFMGDTGSLAIGAALGAGAILQHAVFLLPFIAFIYFVEMASVTLQVLWFKYTKAKTGEGKRLFRRAPLHHHFELAGWSEWRVVLTFWAINLFTSAIGLWLWHLGIIPRWP